ncbi:MAG: gfo/Idh/MocA family oxidoreductase [Candidatus Hydrogenedentota bacterium]|nr:MAG: gfo/Idh/MocA family oxidoreductase [Candidatus Hydrogenedentota bacterium]GIX44326.1 MAG: oxidoreductase [Candidatus Sumerlaea sp.]
MGERHAQILQATPGARVTCIFDQDLERARKVAGDLPVCKDYEEVLRREDVDAVVLALPSFLHVPYGIEAARHGKHVVTEKPIALDVDSGKNLIDACRAAHVLCAVISQNRFADGNSALRRALVSGDFGKPVLVRGSVKWFRHDPYYTESDWRGRVAGEGGGVLMNQATHTLDLLLWMFGYPNAVCGLTANTRPVLETEDVGVALFRFPGDIIGTFEATTSAYPGFAERVEVHGQQASCIVEKGEIIYWEHSAKLPKPNPPEFGPPTPNLEPRYVLFQRQYRNIIGAIQGDEELLVKPEEALAVVAVTRAIYENQAETNRRPLTPTAP